MFYLSPYKAIKERIIFIVGYTLIAFGISLAAILLLYKAYGFGFNKKGNVVQSGLVFLSSQPNPANIYLNGSLQSSTTNTDIELNSGIYNVKLTRSGYRSWQRQIEVDGGSVEHFDYPVLFPTKLTTKELHSFSSAPASASQSPNRRYILVSDPASPNVFDLFDTKNALNVNQTSLSIPSNVLSKPPAGSSDSYTVIAWSNDNQHVLIKHSFGSGYEYVLLDVTDPSQSININQTYNVTPVQLSLINKQYNDYYSFDPSTGLLQSFGSSSPTPKTVLTNIVSFASYEDNTLLYASSNNQPDGQVSVKLDDSGQITNIRTIPSSSTYLLNLTTYNGKLYVAVGDSTDNRVYIYADPAGQVSSNPGTLPVPEQILHVDNPNYLSFSDNTQFIATESGSNFGVYDIFNQQGYNFKLKLPIDTPQPNVTWMDGDRLTYVSGDKVVVVDYDDTNAQKLVAADPRYLPFYDSNYHYLYTLAPSKDNPGQIDLNQTPLLTPSDH